MLQIANMLKLAWSFVISVKNALSFAAACLGLLYFWPDIRDLPLQYGYTWGQALPYRETVAYILLGAAAAWITWSDLRPSFYRWLESKRPSGPKLVPTASTDRDGTGRNTDILCSIGNAGTPCDLVAYLMPISGAYWSSTNMKPVAWQHWNERKVRVLKNHAETCLLARLAPEDGQFYLVCARQDGSAQLHPALRVQVGTPYAVVIQADFVSEPESVDGLLRIFVVAVFQLIEGGGLRMSVGLCRSIEEAETSAKENKALMSSFPFSSPKTSTTEEKALD